MIPVVQFRLRYWTASAAATRMVVEAAALTLWIVVAGYTAVSFTALAGTMWIPTDPYSVLPLVLCIVAGMATFASFPVHPAEIRISSIELTLRGLDCMAADDGISRPRRLHRHGLGLLFLRRYRLNTPELQRWSVTDSPPLLTLDLHHDDGRSLHPRQRACRFYQMSLRGLNPDQVAGLKAALLRVRSVEDCDRDFNRGS